MRDVRVAHISLGAAVLIACGPNGPTGPIEGQACSPKGPYMGSFIGDAIGSVTSAVAGCGYYGVEKTPPLGSAGITEKTRMILSHGERGTFQITVGIFRWGLGFPVGPVNVTRPEARGIYGVIIDNSSDRRFNLTSGSITFYSKQGSTFLGDVDITGTEVGGTATITLTGKLVARCIEQPEPPNDENRPDISAQQKLPCARISQASG